MSTGTEPVTGRMKVLTELRQDFPGWMVLYVSGTWRADRPLPDGHLTLTRPTAEGLRERMAWFNRTGFATPPK